MCVCVSIYIYIYIYIYVCVCVCVIIYKYLTALSVMTVKIHRLHLCKWLKHLFSQQAVGSNLQCLRARLSGP